MPRMHELVSPLTTKRSLWKSPWWCLLVIGIGSFGGLLVMLAGREAAARAFIKNEQQRLLQQAQPIGNESLAESINQRSHSDGTIAWHQIIRMALLANQQWDEVGDQEPLEPNLEAPRIDPERPRPNKPQIEAFLEAVQPLFERIDAAAKYPTPVQPVFAIDGYRTLLEELQATRTVLRIIAIDWEDAVYDRDGDRALQAAQRMRAVAEAYDLPWCLIGEYINQALHNMRYSAIAQGMSVDMWSPSQLEALLQWIEGSPDPARHWRQAIAGERAMALELFRDPRQLQFVTSGQDPVAGAFYRVGRLPSFQRELLEHYRALEAVAAKAIARDPEPQELETLASRNEPHPFNALGTLIAPAVSPYAATQRRQENARRFAQTAIALRMYRARFERWPQRLSALEELDAVRPQWRTVEGESFGYELTSDGVALWGQNPSGIFGTEAVPAQRPSLDAEDRFRGSVVLFNR